MTRVKAPTLRALWHRPIHLLAFGLGSGAVPWAPGTAGTLVAVPLYYWLASLPVVYYLLIVLLLAVLGIWLCGRTARDLDVHDHPGIVWDEIVGYLITMTAAPVGWHWIIMGFLLFRLFDILKPWPVRAIDRKVTGGLGIMLDDVVAGLGAWAVMAVLADWLP